MQDEKPGRIKQPARESSVRGSQTECSVLFVYAIDDQSRPEIWDIRLIADKDCGTRLETFRQNADSNGKFVWAGPKDNRLERVYKIQIQDDDEGSCPLPGDYARQCLFILETVPAPHFQYGNQEQFTGGVIELGHPQKTCGRICYRSFDAKLLLAPAISPYGHAIWKFAATISDKGPSIAWQRFSFCSRKTDSHGDPISRDVSFLQPGKPQRLKPSLKAALTETEPYSNHQWEFQIDNTSAANNQPKILQQLGNVLSSFPARLGGSALGQGLNVGLALFSLKEKGSTEQLTLKVLTVAGTDKNLTEALIFDYRSQASENQELLSISADDTAQLRLSAQPSQELSPGPQTTGNLQFDFGKPYHPVRKNILEFHSIPTWIFIQIWNASIEKHLNGLRLTQAGNPVSFVPKFEESTEGDDRYFWILRYEVQDDSLTSDYPLYARVSRDAITSQSGRHIELVSMRAGRLYKVERNGIARDTSTLRASLPNVSPMIRRGSVDSLLALLRTSPPPEYDPKRRGVSFSFATPIFGRSNGDDPRLLQIRMGSFDLTIQTSDPDTDSDLYGRIDLTPTGQPIIDMNVKIGIADCSPGGQDYAPGDEFAPLNSAWFPSPSRCESGALIRRDSAPGYEDTTGSGPLYEAMFEQESPLTIYVPPKNRSGKYLLQSTESFRDNTSHTIDLYLFNKQPLGGVNASVDVCNQTDLDSINRVFVIDRNPFLIAKVAFLPIGANNPEIPLAIWTNRADRPRGWQVNLSQDKESTSSPVCLTLPPQGIGETMLDEKNKSASGADSAEFYKRLSSFNYSPPTNFHLSVNDEGLTFTAAPWNLRNLLSTRTLAPYVRQIDFELFYGLSCVAEQPLIRLLDTFAIVGQVPGRPLPRLAWTPVDADLDDAEPAYDKVRANWALAYRQLRNRLAVLEPVPENSSALDPSIVLQKNLSCWIRLPAASNLKPPKDLARTDLPNTDDGKTKYEALSTATLRGGATTGFVSKNVYLASVFEPNTTQSRVSSSAQLSEFSFTALGGNGRQMAGFQNNLTRIYADVHLGRAYRYKVERIGRIACFWNVAKHVVVYERRVTPSKQFADPGDQLPEIGWPYIRKVEEFVEIVDDKLDFPPTPEPGSNVSSEQVAELRRRCACITGTQFQPGQRFNVKSDWGIDVGNWGWKIPLWDPSAGKSNPDVYPEPQFHLRLAPHDSQDRAYELKRFRKPEQVFFFTLTKLTRPDGSTVDPDGDPRNWPAQPGIDFVNLPDPVPARDFTNGNSRQFTSPESSCPVGFSQLTFDLESSGPPVNLVEGRSNSPVAVQLATITVSRSVDSTKPLPAVDWGNLTASSDSQFAALRDLENRLTELFKVLLKEFPVDQVLEPGLGTRIKDKVEELIKNELSKLIADAAALKSQLANGPFGPVQFKNKIESIENQALARVLQRIDDAIAQAQKEMAARIDALKNSANFSATEAKAILADIGARISETVVLIGSAPSQSLRYVAQMTGRLALYIDESKTDFSAALARAKTFAARQEATLVQCQSQLRIEFANLQSIEDDFFRSSARCLPTGMADSLSAWRTNLISYFGLFDQKFSAAIKATSKTDFTQRLNAVVSPALDDLDPIKKFLAKYSAFATDQANGWDGLVQRINDQLLATYDSMTRPWVAAINLAQSKAITNYNDFDAALKALLATLSDASSGIRKTLIDNANKALAAADKAASLLDSAFSEFETQLNGAAAKLRAIAQNFANNIDQMQAEMIRYKDRLVSSARNWAEHCAGPLADGITQSKAYQAGDTALRLVRAIGDPPRTAQMKFEQSQLGYYFKQALPGVDLSPAYMALDQGAAALDALKPLGLRLPCSQILDKFIPSDLKNFDLRTIFPNFAGIDFSHLLPGIKVPDFLDSRYVKVTHGLDREKRRAYAKAEIEFTLDTPATILDIGPVKVSVPSANFQSNLTIAASQSGIDERQVSGTLKGDWSLSLAGTDLITLGDAKLRFSDNGGVHFDIDPTKVRLPDFLKFVTEALKGLIDPDSGLSFGAIPGGFQCVLDLPVPDTSDLTSGISGLSLSANLALLFEQEFTIQIGCALGKPEKPFNVAFFILGGGGYCFSAVRFTPSTGRFECLIDLRISASASLAIALGPIRGGVYVYLGVTANFRSGGGSSSFGVIFIIRGDVSICGIISAYVALTLAASYKSAEKAITGEGRLDMEVKICWCFTFKIHQSLSYTLHLGGGSNTGRLRDSREVIVAQNTAHDLGYAPEFATRNVFSQRTGEMISDSDIALFPANAKRVLDAKEAAKLYSAMLF